VSYDEDMPVTAVRLPAALVAQVDALVARCNASEYGHSNRSTMLQALVALGLEKLERKYKP